MDMQSEPEPKPEPENKQGESFIRLSEKQQQPLMENRKRVFGNDKIILEDYVIVRGHHNEVRGIDVKVYGNNNNVMGVPGGMSYVVGDGNIAIGEVWAKGKNNTCLGGATTEEELENSGIHVRWDLDEPDRDFYLRLNSNSNSNSNTNT